jgi:hypothetical protein
VCWQQRAEAQLTLTGDRAPLAIKELSAAFYGPGQDRVYREAVLFESFLLLPGHELRRDLGCTVPWGAGLCGLGLWISVRCESRSYHLDARAGVEPPEQVERLSDVLCAEAGVAHADWQVLGPPGRETLCAWLSGDRDAAFSVAALELTPEGTGYNAVVAVQPRQRGLAGLAPSWERHGLFLRGDEWEAREKFREFLQPLRQRYGAAGALPVPAMPPRTSSGSIPIRGKRGCGDSG